MDIWKVQKSVIRTDNDLGTKKFFVFTSTHFRREYLGIAPNCPVT